MKNITSMVSGEMDQYIATLKTLQASLGDASAIEGSVMIHRVAADMLEQGETLKNIGVWLRLPTDLSLTLPTKL